MGKLHEVLAVEDSLATTFKEILAEARKSFAEKEHLFRGHISVTKATQENEQGSAYVAEGTEKSLVVETVPAKLAYVADHTKRYLDAVAQKELANTVAKADLVVNGKVLLKDAPATLLLGLENKLKAMREVFLAIPTNDESKVWATTDMQHVYTAPAERKFITKKVDRAQVVIPPTEHQPGQYRTYTEDVVVGEKSTQHLSGKVGAYQKSEYLRRLDDLILASKKARQRANEQEVNTDLELGSIVTNYLLAS